jgi:hypothetical protein
MENGKYSQYSSQKKKKKTMKKIGSTPHHDEGGEQTKHVCGWGYVVTSPYDTTDCTREVSMRENERIAER